MENILPNGTYRARATDAQLGETSNKKEQVAIGFELLQPGFEGQFIPYYGTFGEAALKITIKALRTAGWEGDDLSDLSSVRNNSREVYLVIEQETYDGVTRSKVKWVNDGAGGLLKSVLDPAAAKQFAMRMRGAVAGLDLGTQPKAAPGPRSAPRSGGPTEPPPHSDADMPF